MRLTCLYLILIPMTLMSQAGSWQVETEFGFNLSVNQMKTLEGESTNMSNTIRPGGYWSVLGKYQFNTRSSILFGLDQAAYKYQYRYRIDRSGGSGSMSTVYIWGFPLGLEHTWFSTDQLALATSYGIKYRINRLASPISLEASSQLFNLDNQLVFTQELKEYEFRQNNHLLAMFLSAKLSFRIKPSLWLAIKASYNQGLQKHESFRFLAKNSYLLENRTTTDKYYYFSRVSYFALGVSLAYTFKNNKRLDHDKIHEVIRD